MISSQRQSSAAVAVLVFCVLAVGAFLLLHPNNTKTAVVHTLPIKEVEKEGSTPISATSVPDQDGAYRSFKIETRNPGAELAKEVGAKNVEYILAFNRLDAQHIAQGVVITIPPILDDWDALSPFPSELPVAADVPKLLLVSQRIQAFGAYESGKLVRWGTVSTGKQSTPTPSKLYTTNWKGKLVVSSIKDEWIMPWYFNLDNTEGVSLHQYALPGRPASHSCVRMSEENAKWFYTWADQWILANDGKTELASGTPVIVFGTYAYDKTAPWKNLSTDPLATTLSVDDLSQVVSPELSTIASKLARRSQIEATTPAE